LIDRLIFRYATIYATQLVEDGNRLDQAIQVLGRFGADPAEEHLTLYKRIIKDFLGRTQQQLNKATATQAPAILAEALRTMLYKLVNDMKSSPGGRSNRGGGGKYNDEESKSSGHLPWFEKVIGDGSLLVVMLLYRGETTNINNIQNKQDHSGTRTHTSAFLSLSL